MQVKRDYVREHVFPRLEGKLRERRHHLETIDLRWGVETGSADDEESVGTDWDPKSRTTWRGTTDHEL